MFFGIKQIVMQRVLATDSKSKARIFISQNLRERHEYVLALPTAK